MWNTACATTRVALTLILLLAPALALAANSDVETYMRSEMEKQRIPGLALGIVKNGVVVDIRTYGTANLELRVPVKPETIFQSGSVGKQFTSAAVMLLVERGKIKLDDSVASYFPDSPDSWKKITIRHLLTHTSGIPDYTEKQVDYRKDYTEDDLLKILQKLPLNFQPGDKWSYSNSGYMLLGFVIHKASGKFYGDFLKENIFGPLQMTSTRIISQSDIVPNRAAGYQLKEYDIKNQDWVAPSLNTTADGSLYLNMVDFAKWEQAVYAGKILTKESWQQVWAPVKLNSGFTYPYGFGWRLDYERGRRVVEHSGHWQGFSTGISRYTESGLTILILANLADVDTLLMTHIIAGMVDPEVVHPRYLKGLNGSDAQTRYEATRKIFDQLADGKETSLLAPGFAATVDESTSQSLRDIRSMTQKWHFLGCDEVAAKNIELHGAPVERFCYVALSGDKGVGYYAVAFTPDGKAADFYAE